MQRATRVTPPHRKCQKVSIRVPTPRLDRTDEVSSVQGIEERSVCAAVQTGDMTKCPFGTWRMWSKESPIVKIGHNGWHAPDQ